MSVLDLTKGTLTSWPARFNAALAAAARASSGAVDGAVTGLGSDVAGGGFVLVALGVVVATDLDDGGCIDGGRRRDMAAFPAGRDGGA